MTGQAAWYDLRVRIEAAEARRGKRARLRAARVGFANGRGHARTALRQEGGTNDLAPTAPTPKKLCLVIDLDVMRGLPCLRDSPARVEHRWLWRSPFRTRIHMGATSSGTFLNRVHSYGKVVPEGGEVVGERGRGADRALPPKSCLHCEDAPA